MFGRARQWRCAPAAAHARLLSVGLGLLLGTTGACRSERRTLRATATSASSAAASATERGSAPSPSAGGDPSTVAEVRARSFVERWAEVQNAHDFPAYSALYAERFTGLKRVGNYSKRFDRSGWLKDRQPMFRQGVSVRVSELRLSFAAGATRAVFTQDFSAPGFHDTGRKELFLVGLGTEVVIAREEMLVSQLAASEPKPNSAVLAFHRDGPVLDESVRASAVKSSPRLLVRADGDAYDVAVAIAAADLSDATRGWLGRAVTVYAKDGVTCSGAVSRFELRVKAQPHFGMAQAWNGESEQPKASATQIATEIWSIASDDQRFLVGVLDHACHGVWATARALAWVPARSAAPPLRATALAAFKALPRYRELQATFVAETADSVHTWDQVDGEISVVEMRPASRPTIVLVSAHGGAGCASFSGNLSAVWKVAEGGALSSLQVLETGELLRAHGALDANDGAALELLTGPDGLTDEVSVLRPTAGGYARQLLFSTSFWDCGC